MTRNGSEEVESAHRWSRRCDLGRRCALRVQVMGGMAQRCAGRLAAGVAWVLGSSTSADLMWNAVIIGVLVLGLAGWVPRRRTGPTADTGPEADGEVADADRALAWGASGGVAFGHEAQI